MKQTVPAVALMMAAGGAVLKGGLLIDTVREVKANLPSVEINRSALLA